MNLSNGVLSIILCISFFLIFYKGSVLHSFGKFVSFMWLVYLSFYMSVAYRFVELSNIFDVVFIVFFMAMIVSYYFFYYIFSGLDINLPSIKPFISRSCFYFFSILFFILSIVKFFYYFLEFGGFYLFRQGFLDEKLSLHIGISFPIVAAAYFYSQLNRDVVYAKFFGVMLVVLGMVSLSKIFVILSLLFVSGFYKPDFKFSMRMIAFYASIGLLLFSCLHIAMDKLAGDAGDSVFFSIIYTLNGYFLGGLAAFQLVLNDQFSTGKIYGDFISFILQKPTNLTQFNDNGWVKTGEWIGNVYSGFTPWFEYGKIYGLLLYGILIGVVHSIVDYFSIKYSSFAFLRIFSFYPLIFIVFTDGYLGALLMWIAFAFSAFMYSAVKSYDN